MSTERPHALLEIGPVAAAAVAGGVPEVRVSVADAPGGASRLDEAKPDAGGEPDTPFLSRALKAGRAIAAYAVAGVIGWHLYDLARPLHIAWPDLSSFTSTPRNVEEAEFRRVTQKLAADIQALDARLDALEKARGHEARNAQSIEDANRRIDEMKAGVAAEVGALAGQIKEVQREAEAKRAETHVAPEQAESRVAGPEGHAHKPATVAAHVEAHWKRGHRRGDAFDPALHPNAPGAPRPLGSALYRAR